MKKQKLILFLLLFYHLVHSQNPNFFDSTLLWQHKKIPDFQASTIDGKMIDSNYFKRKITILCFYSFNCGPCRYELRLLASLAKRLDKNKYQILMIADASEEDLRDLRKTQSKANKRWKKKMGIDTLAMDIVTECPKNKAKFIMAACSGSISSLFFVKGTPTTFLIDPKNIVKHIIIGFPLKKVEDTYFDTYIKELETSAF